MTTVTDEGLTWYQDRATGQVSGKLDQIALGSGSGSESQTATALDNQVYAGTVADNNIEFIVDDDNPGRVECIITVQGGTEVPADTDINEMLVGVSAVGVTIAIDNFASITVEAGHTEEFTLPILVER